MDNPIYPEAPGQPCGRANNATSGESGQSLSSTDLADQTTIPPEPLVAPTDTHELETIGPAAEEPSVSTLDAPTANGSLPGQTHFRLGQYEVQGELGRGGMGVVYRARQVPLDRTVALKMILAGGHAGPEELTRFRTEAEAVARLQHPNVVQIYEVGEHDGLPYFSLEFCPGGSLTTRLDGKPWAADKAASLTETLARAVHAGHQRGIVHRDLKPANILMGADDSPKITDFGLAKKFEDAAGQTQSGAIMGTPSYMAPEQAGTKGVKIGPAADVYALGAVLYELLTGRPPFQAATPLDTVLQVVSLEPVPPRQRRPKTPRDLNTICLKCLQKDPRQRYKSAEALAEDLRRFRAGEPIKARPVGDFERFWRWCRRKPMAASLIAMVLLASCGTLGAFWWYREDRAQLAAQKAAKELEDLEQDFSFNVNLGAVYTTQKKIDEAIAAYRKAMELKPTHPYPYINMSLLLMDERDDVEGAIQMARKAVEVYPQKATAHVILGNALLRKPDYDGAIAAYREALKRDATPDTPRAYCNLGFALNEQRKHDEALTVFGEAREKFGANKGWQRHFSVRVDHTKRLLEREAKLPELLKGTFRPAGEKELLEFAEFTHDRKNFATAAGLYEETFAVRKHRSPTAQNYFSAARAAARAGAAKDPGADSPDDAARSVWRQKARAWLRLGLETWRADLERSPFSRGDIAKEMRKWREEPDLASLRDFNLLPLEERRDCEAFWGEVQELSSEAEFNP